MKDYTKCDLSDGGNGVARPGPAGHILPTCLGGCQSAAPSTNTSINYSGEHYLGYIT